MPWQCGMMLRFQFNNRVALSSCNRPFYIQVCAFCKAQYKMLSSIGEEQVFERFYEPLGDAASKYAGLLGYTPGSTRDPNTLMPKSNHPIKNGLIIQEIDLMAGSIWGSGC